MPLILPKNVAERFDLYWGIAPEGTAKYQAREKAKSFLAAELEAQKWILLGDQLKKEAALEAQKEKIIETIESMDCLAKNCTGEIIEERLRLIEKIKAL